ncbi:hypothetical protein MXB_5121 [Myxobolus squamalis]|nr:hypothetical protein MXB_5121 [Myxobolus squamalis]
MAVSYYFIPISHLYCGKWSFWLYNIWVSKSIASDPRFSFWGGINVGCHISVQSLLNMYDCVVLKHSKEVASYRRSKFLLNLLESTQRVFLWDGTIVILIVSTYFCVSHLKIKPILSGTDLVIIGNGNVAVDVARIFSSNSGRLKVRFCTKIVN